MIVLDLGLLAGDVRNWNRLADLHAPDRIVGLIPPGGLDETIAIRAYRAGVAGLLVAFADIGNGQLSYAVRCVASGKPFYGPTVQAIMRDQGASHWGRKRTDGLTPRELEVARLAATGMKRNAIAQELYLSPLTVKRHLHSVRTKLGVTNPWDLEQLRRRLEGLQR